MRKSGILIPVFLICFTSVLSAQDIQLAVTRIESLGVKPETKGYRYGIGFHDAGAFGFCRDRPALIAPETGRYRI